MRLRIKFAQKCGQCWVRLAIENEHRVTETAEAFNLTLHECALAGLGTARDEHMSRELAGPQGYRATISHEAEEDPIWWMFRTAAGKVRDPPWHVVIRGSAADLPCGR